MKFGEDYTKYWKSAVTKSVDGTIIAGIEEAKHFLQHLDVERGAHVLDLGCSFGRMYEALATYWDHIYGIDPDPFAVEKARHLPYKEIHQGSAEETGFDKDSFDLVFCWAVFDVVDHKKGLIEINRILKNTGRLLITGKNDNYHPDDSLAFKAEKNAFLKGFPNRFTDLRVILRNFKNLGFHLDKLFISPYRGDFGLLNYIELIDDGESEYLGYDYLILCHKIEDEDHPIILSENFECEFSKTTFKIAAQSGYKSPKELFEFIGID